MADWQLYLGLFLALAIGFWQGRRSKQSSPESLSLDKQYFQGLNYLLNEQPDAAVDSFIKALEVNSDTLETHLALGKLLRKRGEVDKAIKIHQNLLARPGLSLEQSQQAQFELAMDFSKAGLLDRAEGLLQSLIENDGPYKISALKLLLEVYRDEREWEEGLSVLHKLSGIRFSKSYEEWAPVRAHFCCELAEEGIQGKDFTRARQWLKQALTFDKRHVRASLLLGQLEIQQNNYSTGITQLTKILELHPTYITEALPHLAKAYRRVNRLDKFKQLLQESYLRHPLPETQLTLAETIYLVEGEKSAFDFLVSQVQSNPSGPGLHKLLDYYLQNTEGKTQVHLGALKTVMEKVISQAYSYQCNYCGFKGNELHWLCPTCKHWGSIKPSPVI